MRSLGRNLLFIFAAYAVGASEDEGEPSDGPSTGHEVEERDDEDGQNMSMIMAQSEKRMDMYDEDGWHTHADWASVIIEPKTLQPYYLMPLFFGAKTMMTLIIFGFNLAFSKKTPNWKDYPKCLMKFVASCGFIALSLNGYYCDYRQYQNYAARTTTNWQAFCVLMATWVTSSNYVAARAIWTSTLMESPGALLQLKEPKYTAFPSDFPAPTLRTFPIFPGTSWLEPVKHIYLLVLLPYFIPSLIWQILAGLIGLYIATLGSHCSLFIGIFKTACLCGLCFWPVVLTLGFWTWAKDILMYQVWLLIPIYEMAGIQIWAMALAPAFMTLVFAVFLAVLSCSSKPCEELPNAMKTLNPAGGLVIGDDDVKALKMNNKTLLMANFKDAELARLPDPPDPAAPGYNAVGAPPQERVDLTDTKLAIFMKTLMDMGQVTLEQMSVLFILRATAASTFEEYVSAAALTLSERHAETYIAHMRGLADESRASALDAVWLLL